MNNLFHPEFLSTFNKDTLFSAILQQIIFGAGNWKAIIPH